MSNSEAQVIHTDVGNVTHIEVHPNDILKNLRMIKQSLAGDIIDKPEPESKPHLVVVEDENE